MKLRYPPVVEAWIEFHARGSETEETSPVGLDEFFREIECDYPTIEQQVEKTFQVVERSLAGLPVQLAGQRKLRRVRAFDGTRRHCVQVGPDVLVVNLIRGDGPYEGFHHLLTKAREQFLRFARIFRPRSIPQAALHYTDVVLVPRQPGAQTRLEDLFRIGVHVPEDGTWPLGRIDFTLSVGLSSLADQPDEMILGFRREPPTGAKPEDRFRLDWHAVCSQLDTLSVESLETRLTRVHDAMKSRFRSCFTDRTWALFEEEREAR